MEDGVVLVTGASGYIATHIVQQLLEAGYKVRGTVRALQDDKKVAPLRNICPAAQHNLELVEADLLRAESWIPAVRGCTYVIHTASPVPWMLRNPNNEDDVIQPAVEGTLSVLRACREEGNVRRVVVTSSLATVNSPSDSMAGHLYTDKDWIDLTVDEVVYSKSKVLAEKAAWDFVGDFAPNDEHFELVTVLPSIAVGPALCSYLTTSMAVSKTLFDREFPMLVHASFHFIDVRDVAQAHIRAMVVPEAAGRRFLVTGERLWLKDVADMYDKEFGKYGYSIPTRVMPKLLMRVFALFKEDARMALKFWGKVYDYDNTPLKDVLGVTPRDVRQGLMEIAYSMIDKGFVRKTEAYVKAHGTQE